MPHIFGPVPSRRLGMSLGVDLIPYKTCTYDCLYCQVGKTTLKTIDPDCFFPVKDVIEELEKKIENNTPDTITLAGSGEPTLHSKIDEVIASIKKITDIRIAVLTNGSCFWKDEVRERVLGADMILPTLCTANEKTFCMIHRPHAYINNALVIDGLKKLRHDFKKDIFLEVVLLSGINDTEEELKKLKKIIEYISPDRIQLNTVVRPPADSRALPVERVKMEEVRKFFGKKTEIVAEGRGKPSADRKDGLEEKIMDMVKRRPLRSADISRALGLSLPEIEGLVKALSIKGFLLRREYSGEIYYLTNNN